MFRVRSVSDLIDNLRASVGLMLAKPNSSKKKKKKKKKKHFLTKMILINISPTTAL